MKKTLDIIIVNWNTGTQLYECLNSISRARIYPFRLHRVVVVDNNSKDESLRNIDKLPLPLTIIKNETNKGFAAACNQGAEGSKADYLLFLNPDTQLFEDSLIKPLVFMELPENKQIGIVGIQLIDEKGKISRTCARFPTLLSFFFKITGLNYLFPNLFPSYAMLEWDHTTTKRVDQVMGAFFLVRREVFVLLEGFDERFFVYFEDLDFSLRAYKMGWKSIYLTEAQAFHKGGGSSSQVKALRLFYSLNSRIKYAYKHFNFFSATLLLILTLLVEPISRSVLAIIKGSKEDFLETLIAFWYLWKDLLWKK